MVASEREDGDLATQQRGLGAGHDLAQNLVGARNRHQVVEGCRQVLGRGLLIVDLGFERALALALPEQGATAAHHRQGKGRTDERACARHGRAEAGGERPRDPGGEPPPSGRVALPLDLVDALARPGDSTLRVTDVTVGWANIVGTQESMPAV